MSECALNGRFAYATYIDAFPPHVNDMTSWQSSSKISWSAAPFFNHHGVVIQHLVSDMILSLISTKNVH